MRVLAAFPGFTEAARLTEDNWIALRLTASADPPRPRAA